MSNYILSCCSTADLTQEQFDARDIHYVCFHFQLDDKVYPDDLGKSISFDEFYQAIADGADTKTSQVNVDEFIEYFEPFLKEGKDILHVSLSSGNYQENDACRYSGNKYGKKKSFPSKKKSCGARKLYVTAAEPFLALYLIKEIGYEIERAEADNTADNVGEPIIVRIKENRCDTE